MSIRDLIQSDVNKALASAGLPGEVRIVSTSEPKFGDYTTSWALQQSRILGKSPHELATTLIEALAESEVYEKPELVEPGFINFRLSKAFLVKHLSLVLAEGSRFGSASTYKGKKALVEYSSPNVAKPMHVGHLRNTNIGQSLINILSFVGYETISDNHLGDWGTQFGRMLWAYKMWGHSITDPNVDDLVKLYVRFHEEAKTKPHLLVEAKEEFLRLEKGDKENVALWKRFTDISTTEFDRIYRDLGAKFDHSYGESAYKKEFDKVTKELVGAGVVTRDPDGSVVAKFDEMPPLVLIKSDGATLYGVRDLATAKFRRDKFNPDLVLLVVAVEQTLYWEQVFELLRKMGWMGKANYVHVSYGLTRLMDGKMSTRTGDIVAAADLLNEAKARAEKLLAEKNPGKNPDGSLVRAIAAGSIKWADLKIARESGVAFDWDRVFSLDGNSGPYMQYSYARTQSILKKAPKDDLRGFDAELLTDGLEQSLLRMLAKFPEIVEESASTFSPHIIAHYSFSLAQEFSRFYETTPVLSSEGALKRSRLALVAAVGQTIKNSLHLLSIPTPEKI